MPDPVIPDDIRAAIHAGHVALVVIFCDRCSTEHAADYTGSTRDVRIAAARRHLAATAGWSIGALDLCPDCADEIVDQPEQACGVERSDADLDSDD